MTTVPETSTDENEETSSMNTAEEFVKQHRDTYYGGDVELIKARDAQIAERLEEITCNWTGSVDKLNSLIQLTKELRGTK